MKLLTPAGFIQSIEYTSEKVLKVLGMRKPQAYRLSGSQLSEPRIRIKQRRLSF